VKSRKQAIAIGLSEARKKGAKVPPKKKKIILGKSFQKSPKMLFQLPNYNLWSVKYIFCNHWTCRKSQNK